MAALVRGLGPQADRDLAVETARSDEVAKRRVCS
jgi:hypothetical protein